VLFPVLTGKLEHLLQGFVVVDSGTALEQVQATWKAEKRWAFALDFSPLRPVSAQHLAARGLSLPGQLPC
jgi:hypothetical protein